MVDFPANLNATGGFDRPVKSSEEELKDLLAENLKYNRAIYADTQKIRRYLFWQTVANVVWIVLVIAPIILAVIFLPPLLQGLLQNYQDLLGNGQGTFDLLKQLEQIK